MGDAKTVYDVELGALIYETVNSYTVSITYPATTDAPFINIEQADDGSFKLSVIKELAVEGKFSALLTIHETDSEGVETTHTIEIKSFIFQVKEDREES